ncbi:hypothetical protein L5515_009061 [Caenorhabditis briggsae]|uniref:Uncharacterized protein n=1 Tax=Caenorhabditis briggsae TaxID=6238 RepID=A0AAE9F9A2_CAEBR|nr:hypothetical protein L5515_009061 [Caenorhabditis briggsae]
MCSPSTSNVRFITFINTSYIEAGNLDNVFNVLLKLEVVGLLLRKFSIGPANFVYGLSERFQLAENIKMCKVLKKVQISILFFNIGCSSILLMDYFEVDIMLTYISYVAFNFLALVYGITIPIIVHFLLPEWQKETRRLVIHSFCCKTQAIEEIPKSTFGEKMIYHDHKQEANIYFNQFNKATH